MKNSTLPEAYLEFSDKDFQSKFQIKEDIITIGRNSTNTIVLAFNEKDLVVSGLHAEIVFEKGVYNIKDLNSTNGTYLNKHPVKKAILKNRDLITFGKNGPEACFLVKNKDTIISRLVPERILNKKKPSSKSVKNQVNPLNLTEFLAALKDRKKLKKFLTDSRILISVFVLLVILFVILTLVVTNRKVNVLEGQLQSYESEITKLQEEITTTKDTAGQQLKMEQLNKLLIQRDLLLKNLKKEGSYSEDFLENELIAIMKKFRADTTDIPPYFISQVRYFVDFYTGKDRPETEAALKNSENYLQSIYDILDEKQLPRELAYIPFVESYFNPLALNKKSGAKGLWQLMIPTAREYGLIVNDRIDERTDVVKSTLVAREYLSDLTLIFGLESFMLVLACYNLGDANIRFRLKQIDNIHDRNFFTLTKMGALPVETVNYVPKFIAAVIIANNKKKYGF